MNKADVLNLVADAKAAMIASMDKLAADVEALEDNPNDDEEKEALKAKVAELEVAVSEKEAVIAGKITELSDVKSLLAKADALAKEIDASIPD